MARIAILDRTDMNAEQARVYDVAKQSSGIVGGPYYAYIRLPKLFEACQNLRASLSSGPLSDREQQIVNFLSSRGTGMLDIRGSRRFAARSPLALTRRSLTRSTRMELPAWLMRASELVWSWRVNFSQARASATKPIPLRKRRWGWKA